MSTTKWGLDPTHSEITFKIRHLMVSNVSGNFGNFTVSAETEDEDFSTAKISFGAHVNSINTGNEQRDGHLQSADFFDAAAFPAISFESTSIEKDGDNAYKLHGHLTVKDVSKPVTFNAELGGIANDPYGNRKAGFSIEGKINRKDFGLTWNATTEAGGLLVGEDVKLAAEIQVVKQA
jgi:polyisoprenoid-binding protein YceI